MARHRIAALSGLFVPLVAAAGCSLINSYDAVKPLSEGGAPADDASGDDVSTGGSDGAMASESGGSSGDATSDAVTSDVSSDAGDGASEGSMTTGGPEASIDAGSPAGAIVVAGSLSTNNDYVLAVLDPTTGAQKSQESMGVAGVVYDGAQDIWYIFDTQNGTAFPGATCLLHVRRLDTRPLGTWAWTELGRVTVPSPVSGTEIVSLSNRLVYLSFAPADSSAQPQQLTALDTTNITTVGDGGSVSITSSPPLSYNPNGLAGLPSMASVGGTLVLVQNTTGGVVNIAAMSLTSTGFAAGGSGVLGSVPSPSADVVGYGSGLSSTNGYEFLFATPFFIDGGPSGGSLQTWTVASGPSLETGADVPFASTASRLTPIAFSVCDQVAFVGEGLVSTGSQNEIFAIPIGGSSTVGSYPVTSVTSVSGLVYEPFTQTLMAWSTAGGGNGFIIALQLGGSSTAPTLVNRAPPLGTWSSAPSTLVPRYAAVRNAYQCP
jgi:hypothetical protein